MYTGEVLGGVKLRNSGILAHLLGNWIKNAGNFGKYLRQEMECVGVNWSITSFKINAIVCEKRWSENPISYVDYIVVYSLSSESSQIM